VKQHDQQRGNSADALQFFDLPGRLYGHLSDLASRAIRPK
jgi:hypothetical protein